MEKELLALDYRCASYYFLASINLLLFVLCLIFFYASDTNLFFLLFPAINFLICAYEQSKIESAFKGYKDYIVLNKELKTLEDFNKLGLFYGKSFLESSTVERKYYVETFYKKGFIVGDKRILFKGYLICLKD